MNNQTTRNRSLESPTIWEIERKVMEVVDLPDHPFLWSALQSVSKSQPFDDLYVVAFRGFKDMAGSFAVRYSEAREALDTSGAVLDALIHRLASEVLGYEANGVEHQQEKFDLANKGLDAVEAEMSGLHQRRDYLINRRMHARIALAQLGRTPQGERPMTEAELPSTVIGRGQTYDEAVEQLASAIGRYAEELHGGNDDDTQGAPDPSNAT